jgi:eukaryotic-like serine/threonine-protein kinase
MTLTLVTQPASWRERAAPPRPRSTRLAVPTVAAATALARIGPYAIEGTLGEGAMGVVYLARDPRLNRRVALKTIRKSLLDAAPAAATERLRHEAQAAARLQHAGIVAVYEYGEDAGQAFIAMEHVHGTPLAQALARPQPLPLDDVLCLMVQLLAALECAHAQGVWHRDIKPANLMVTRQGRLKITDFGIARIDAVALTQEAVVMGSPGYMAPECYRGAGVDHRADLFACGVLLYELLAGVRPFRGSAERVMHQTLHQGAPSLASARANVEPAEGGPDATALAAFEPVLQRALAKAPEERYLSALEMRHELMFAGARPVPSVLSETAMALLALRGDAATTLATLPPRERAALARVRSVGAVIPVAAPIAAQTAAAIEPPAPPPEARDGSAAESPARFEPALLDRLSALLADEIGPLAACLVRRAVAHSDSTAALVMRLANEGLPPERRAGFIESARGGRVAARPPVRANPPTGAHPPLLGETPLAPALLEAARALLARRIGPLAALLVQRAASAASTREQFIERLADLVSEPGRSERERWVAALCCCCR